MAVLDVEGTEVSTLGLSVELGERGLARSVDMEVSALDSGLGTFELLCAISLIELYRVSFSASNRDTGYFERSQGYIG